MDLQNFIEKFAEQFDEFDASEFNANTEFKNLNEWSSLSALSIIAMVYEEFDITLKGDDIQKSTTIEDLFNIINSK